MRGDWIWRVYMPLVFFVSTLIVFGPGSRFEDLWRVMIVATLSALALGARK